MEPNSVWGVRAFQGLLHQGLYLNDEFNWAGRLVCQGRGREGNGGSRGRAGFQAKGSRCRSLESRNNTKKYKAAGNVTVRAEGREGYERGKQHTVGRSLDFILLAKGSIWNILYLATIEISTVDFWAVRLKDR